MVFVPPTWFEGLIWHLSYLLLPMIILGILGIISLYTNHEAFGVILLLLVVVWIPVGVCSMDYVWHNSFEVPSVDEKVITVKEWQPRVGLHSDGGMMHIDSADDLMLVTTDDECFFNMENFWFGKFDTRDTFNKLKEGGTYKIKYYGWREPFNSGFPNILSVEEVIDETNASDVKFSDYFGTKLIS